MRVDVDIPKKDAATVRRAKIIIADDSEVNRKLATVFLRTGGYKVTAVSSGRELLGTLGTDRFDLVLMDVLMPEMDGIAATAAVRALPGDQSETPIIAMTAYSSATARELCLDAGMNDYVSKPISRQELLDTVARWLGNDQDRTPESLGTDDHAQKNAA